MIEQIIPEDGLNYDEMFADLWFHQEKNHFIDKEIFKTKWINEVIDKTNGIFDHDEFRRSVLNALRLAKGLPALKNTRNVYAEKQHSYDALADVVRRSLDMDKLHAIMGGDRA